MTNAEIAFYVLAVPAAMLVGYWLAARIHRRNNR